jgi:hypothetical protein
MLKNEPKAQYYYEVIKYIRIPEDKQLSILGKYYHPNGIHSYIGGTLKSPKDDLDKEYFKKIGNVRESFIGDYQKKQDELFGYSLKDSWISQISGQARVRTETIIKEKIVYIDRWIPIVLVQKFKSWIVSKFTKDEKIENSDSDLLGKEFEDLILGKQHNDILYQNNITLE